jgi:probable blue pigment (indigoidine) exporter
MEGTPPRVALVTAVAPVIWGSTYLVTTDLLPPDRPLFAAAVRALPAGLLLLAFRRRLPRGIWWWRALVLGVANIGLFFPVLFLAAYLVPGGLASTIQAVGPLVVMGMAWAMLREPAGSVRVVAAVVGLVGVALLVLRAPGAIDPLGVAAAFASVVISSFGFVLIRRWPAPVDLVTLTAWQLTAGGLVLVPIALLLEGAPPHIDGPAAIGFLWLAVPGTVVAYLCWFHGLTRMPAAAVSLIGLLNPVVATSLGVLVAHERFGLGTAVGMALVLGGVVVGQPAVAAAVRRATRGRHQVVLRRDVHRVVDERRSPQRPSPPETSMT